MLATLITISIVFSVVLSTHNLLLEAIHKDALSEPKARSKRTE